MTFLQRIKKFPRLAVVPIVVISGHDRASAEQPALDAGARAFLQKPVRNEDVLAAIEAILGTA